MIDVRDKSRIIIALDMAINHYSEHIKVLEKLETDNDIGKFATIKMDKNLINGFIDTKQRIKLE